MTAGNLFVAPKTLLQQPTLRPSNPSGTASFFSTLPHRKQVPADHVSCPRKAAAPIRAQGGLVVSRLEVPPETRVLFFSARQHLRHCAMVATRFPHPAAASGTGAPWRRSRSSSCCRAREVGIDGSRRAAICCDSCCAHASAHCRRSLPSPTRPHLQGRVSTSAVSGRQTSSTWPACRPGITNTVEHRALDRVPACL